MKKLMVIFGVITLFYACGGGDKAATEEKKDTATKTETSAVAAAHPGLDMIAASDCFTCHRPNEKNIGPAYNEVAKKYEGATPAIIDTLATKIIKGGVGVWGQVLMTPHPTVSMDSAREMVRYILTLKDLQ